MDIGCSLCFQRLEGVRDGDVLQKAVRAEEAVSDQEGLDNRTEQDLGELAAQ